MIHFDTSFVVDFLREGTRGELGPARVLFKSLPRQPRAISVFALCELLAGAAQASRGDQEREKVRLFCSRLRTVYPGDGFAEDYGNIVGTLKRSGRNPRAMDGSSPPPPCATAPIWSHATARTSSECRA